MEMTLGPKIPPVISQWQPSQKDKEGNRGIVCPVLDRNFCRTIQILNNQEEEMFKRSIIPCLMILQDYGNLQNALPFQISFRMKSHCQIIEEVITNL